MRVAFAGTHRVGKTTLVEAVAERLPGYVAFDEPYRMLEDEGYELSDPPTVEDFERQLHQSIAMISDAPANALFDRCPLDFVAYAQAIDDDIDLDDWIDAAREGMETLDLVIVVPIEHPDRIVVGAHEDKLLRTAVDERLQALLTDVETIEVSGSVDQRVQQVLAALSLR